MNREFLFKRAYLVLLILVAITLPSKWIYINSIAVACLGVLYFIDKGLLSRLGTLFKNKIFISATLLYFLYIISLLYSEDLKKGFSHLETRAPLLAFPLIILSYYKIEKKELRTILIAFLGSCIFFSGLCFLSTIYINFTNDIDYVYYNSWFYSSESLVANFGFHPSYFSIYCTFCIFITIFLYNEKLLKNTATVLIIFYLLLFQLFLAARGGILASLTILVGTILYEAYIRKKLLIGIVSTLIITLGLTYAIFQVTIIAEKFRGMFDYEVTDLNKRFKLTRRFEKWESAAILYERHPIIGTGIGDSRDELREIFKEKGFEEAYENKYDAHNLFLETATSVGIVGVIALGLLFYTSFKICLKNRDPLFLQFLSLFVLFSIVEAAFSVQKGVVFFAFFNTLFLAYNYTSETKEKETIS